MAKTYPRIVDEDSKYYGLLDDAALISHEGKMSIARLKQLIVDAIRNASRKSGRQILAISSTSTSEEVQTAYENAGWELFKYFRDYATDPAATAHKTCGRNCRDVAIELFHIRTLQKERMNSAWRYQFLIVDCAEESRRFKRVSDLGLEEADFSAMIDFIDRSAAPLSLYVSVKNRSDTMGGQDWPKAIRALEAVAKNDRNRVGAYCCVFGIAMDPGVNERRIIRNSKTKQPYSENTELWRSNFFWPFFSNYSYEEIMMVVLDVLQEIDKAESPALFTGVVPRQLVDIFGFYCQKAQLVNEQGNFNDPRKLVEFFCSNTIPVRKKRKPDNE
jgi:hypothetical protein